MPQTAAQNQTPHEAAMQLWDGWVKQKASLADLATGAQALASRLRDLGEPAFPLALRQSAQARDVGQH